MGHGWTRFWKSGLRTSAVQDWITIDCHSVVVIHSPSTTSVPSRCSTVDRHLANDSNSAGNRWRSGSELTKSVCCRASCRRAGPDIFLPASAEYSFQCSRELVVFGRLAATTCEHCCSSSDSLIAYYTDSYDGRSSTDSRSRVASSDAHDRSSWHRSAIVYLQPASSCYVYDNGGSSAANHGRLGCVFAPKRSGEGTASEKVKESQSIDKLNFVVIRR